DDEAERGVAMEERLAEVAARRVGNEADELCRKRIRETERIPELGPVRLGGFRHDQGDRVAAGVQDREGDQRNADTNDDEAEEAPDQEGRHGAASVRAVSW